ncbi:MAG: DUF305 domain-containing protein [Pseudonocardiaceae bacterium]
MRIHSATAVLAAVAAAGGLLAGCGTTSTSPADAPPAASSATGVGQQHNQADTTFLQGMIPHHAQAIAMAQMAPIKAASPQVKTLADRIQTEQGPQIAQMSGLLRSWGAAVPATNQGMAGMHAQMPGMMSDQQMRQMMASAGAGFDRMFLQMMITHHQGAVTMSHTELAQGSNPAARHLAQQIITGQQAEISQMQTLLQQT